MKNYLIKLKRVKSHIEEILSTDIDCLIKQIYKNKIKELEGLIEKNEKELNITIKSEIVTEELSTIIEKVKSLSEFHREINVLFETL